MSHYPEEFTVPESYDQVGSGAFRARAGSDKNLSVTFYYKDEWDSVKKEIKKVEMVRIRRPGDKLVEYNSYPTDAHKVRFATEYAMFKRGDARLVGTPIENWTYLQVDQLETLKYLGVQVVEQIPEMGDEQVAMLGLDGPTIKAEAVLFNMAMDDKNGELKLQKELAKRDTEIEDLKKQVSALLDATGKPIVREAAPKATTKKSGRPKKAVKSVESVSKDVEIEEINFEEEL